MKQLNNNNTVLVNKYLHGEKEELLLVISKYIESVLETYSEIAKGAGIIFELDDLRKAGYKHLEFAMNKHVARLVDCEKEVINNVPDFITYYKWFARQGMLEYLKEAENNKNDLS